MISRLAERLIFSALGLLILGWCGYHAFQYYYQPLQMETAFEYTVTRSITANGIAIRDEEIIEQPVSGIENYLYEDGSRVSIGQTIAEFYASTGTDQNFKRLRELEEEIAMLTDAQDKKVNNYANTDMLSRDIREQLNQLTQMSNTGWFEGTKEIRGSMTSLLNRRQIATGKEEDFSARIQTLQSERDRLSESALGESVLTVKAPSSGYFVKTLDGYEELLSSADIKDMEVADYIRLLERPQVRARQNLAGKIVTDQNWYFAAVVHVYDTEWVRVGQAVNLEFPLPGLKVSATVSSIVLDEDGEDAMLVFRCKQISEDLVNLRDSEVTIHFLNYTGLRISSSSIRFQDNVRGVYVLEDNIVRFKTLDVLYEEQAFVLSDINYVVTGNTIKANNSGQVSLFDQIIVKGNDLYDGKVMQ